MRNALILMLLILGLAAAVTSGNQNRDNDANGATEKHKPDKHRNPKLLMRDDFNGNQLNGDLWNTCHWWENTGCTIATNHELERYWPGQVALGAGMLSLIAEPASSRDRDPAHPYASGMIASGPPHGSRRAKFAFRFGTATIRARVPAGKGLWPAFWLLPANRHSEPEIDVMEILGDTPDVVRMHLHYRDREGHERSRGRAWAGTGFAADWHTFTIRWKPGKLTWLVDGVRRFRIKGREVPRKAMYPILNLAVGGTYPGAPTAETPFPSAFDVDYVEVWR
jgi:beta-glucanase (GH16 family)